MPARWVEVLCRQPELVGVRPERGAPRNHDASARGPPHQKAPDPALRSRRLPPAHSHLSVPCWNAQALALPNRRLYPRTVIFARPERRTTPRQRAKRAHPPVRWCFCS